MMPTMDNTPNIRVACQGFRGPKAKYFETLGAYEMQERAAPRRDTLRRWRREVPEDACFIVPVPAAVVTAGFAGEAAEAAWDEAARAAELLGADTFLLRTPGSFRPTAANRAALISFFEGRSAGRRIAWWAEGLWESQPEDRDAVCAAAGLTPVVDPLQLDDDEPLPGGDFFYWRLMGGHGMGRFSDYDIDTVMSHAAERHNGVIVFTHPRMRPDALRMAAALALE